MEHHDPTGGLDKEIKRMSNEIADDIDERAKRDIYRGTWDEAVDKMASRLITPDNSAVDPKLLSMYDSEDSFTKPRSNTMTERTESLMSEDEMTGIFEAEKEQLTVREFITKLEGFLDETLESDARGNVFMSENGEGVCLNVLVGAAFADSSSEVNQVNVIISPTDRGFLGSEGVSMGDSEYTDDPTLRTDDFEDGDDEFWDEDDEEDNSAFDRAMELL